jgi:hypothetical protein
MSSGLGERSGGGTAASAIMMVVCSVVGETLCFWGIGKFAGSAWECGCACEIQMMDEVNTNKFHHRLLNNCRWKIAKTAAAALLRCTRIAAVSHAFRLMEHRCDNSESPNYNKLQARCSRRRHTEISRSEL